VAGTLVRLMLMSETMSLFLKIDEDNSKECKLKQPQLLNKTYAFIQLTKFKKKESELVTLVDKWTYFLKNARKLKLVPDNTDDEGLKEAYEEAEMFNWSKEMLMSYTVAGMREHDTRNELEKAQENGIEIGTLNVARNLLIEGVTLDLVSKVTGLSMDIVQKIVDEVTQK
jgi:predicted transposase/invertase (TIGR01784 family)